MQHQRQISRCLMLGSVQPECFSSARSKATLKRLAHLIQAHSSRIFFIFSVDGMAHVWVCATADTICTKNKLQSVSATTL